MNDPTRDGYGYEEEKDGRPGCGFITCLTQDTFNWVAKKVAEVELDGERFAKAWPWLPRSPRISSAYPWIASLFVPLTFPFNENNFIASLTNKHGLEGEARELVIMEKTSKTGHDGSFFRFGIDEAMRSSLKARDFILHVAIHRLLIFVLGTNNFLLKRVVSTAKNLKNARKRKRAAEKR